MTNFKSIISSATILLVILLYSCDSKDPINENCILERVNYAAIRKDATININKLDQKTNSRDAIQNDLNKYFSIKSKSFSLNENSSNQTEFKISLPPHYNSKEAYFMLNFYQDLANSYDYDILNLINKKRDALNSSSV
jgi:hypothetical protein